MQRWSQFKVKFSTNEKKRKQFNYVKLMYGFCNCNCKFCKLYADIQLGQLVVKAAGLRDNHCQEVPTT